MNQNYKFLNAKINLWNVIEKLQNGRRNKIQTKQNSKDKLNIESSKAESITTTLSYMNKPQNSQQSNNTQPFNWIRQYWHRE